jgi:putative tricarboxylic transport membrane protein
MDQQGKQASDGEGAPALKLSSDLLSGLLFTLLGVGALYVSWQYPAGTAARMGPGYFPHLVSGLLTLLGVILILRSWFQPGEFVDAINLRPLLFVLIGTVSFGVLIERTGLLPASIVLIIAGRLARPDFKIAEVLLLAVGLAAAAALLFVYALGLGVKLHPF